MRWMIVLAIIATLTLPLGNDTHDAGARVPMNGAWAGPSAPIAEPAISNAVLYVSPSGSDSNNGRSWASAKATILAAYDGLSASGGTIYIASGSFVGGTIANQGVWIVGPNDPSYNSPLPGWRKQKMVRFVGVGQTAGVQFDIGNAVKINGGQPGGSGWVQDP